MYPQAVYMGSGPKFEFGGMIGLEWLQCSCVPVPAPRNLSESSHETLLAHAWLLPTLVSPVSLKGSSGQRRLDGPKERFPEA